ncbi:hypothetical protein V8D89_006990 [Ganoderma adspersum]
MRRPAGSEHAATRRMCCGPGCERVVRRGLKHLLTAHKTCDISRARRPMASAIGPKASTNTSETNGNSLEPATTDSKIDPKRRFHCTLPPPMSYRAETPGRDARHLEQGPTKSEKHRTTTGEPRNTIPAEQGGAVGEDPCTSPRRTHPVSRRSDEVQKSVESAISLHFNFGATFRAASCAPDGRCDMTGDVYGYQRARIHVFTR